MLEIFIVTEGVVRPTAQALLEPSLKKIWERDKGKNKGCAINEFSYIEFMITPYKTNPYKDYKEEDRHRKLSDKYLEGKDPDPVVSEACKIYYDFIYEASFSFQFLEAVKEAAENLKLYLKKVDLGERTNSGSMVIKPADLTRALKDTSEVFKNVQELEKNIHEEIDSVKRRANKKVNYFEK